MNKPLIVLAGPTAAGKTSLSIMLAKRIGGEIISADSMQVYRHMDIGSAKIAQEEKQGISHYLIDVLEPDDEFHVVKFQQMAQQALEEIYQNGHIPIVTGGTGFYIQALIRDVDFTEGASDPAYRQELQRIAQTQGNAVLHQMLAEVDPVSASQIHVNNVKRVIRALEFYHESQIPISRHNARERQKESPYNLAYFVLTDNRENLFQRIDKRVDRMLEQGLVAEVKQLIKMGCTADMVSMQGLGYKQLLAWMEGAYSYEEAVRQIKRDTRRFAKRQLSWFRREKDAVWLNRQDYQDDQERLLEAMLTILREKRIWA